MSSSGTHVLWPVTKRRPDGAVVTRLGPGRVTKPGVERFLGDCAALRGERWLLDARAATAYDVGAVAAWSAGMARLREAGLRCVAVVSNASFVRMGASVVAMSAGVPFAVVDTPAEADAALAGP